MVDDIDVLYRRYAKSTGDLAVRKDGKVDDLKPIATRGATASEPITRLRLCRRALDVN
jgi:hypothetical protein